MKINTTLLLLLLTLGIYVVGACLIKPDNNLPNGLKQEHTIYSDREGEEHESEGLIEIENVGKVLSYRDIYLCPLPFIMISGVLAKVLFNSTDIKFVIYANCILGVLLIWVTNASNVIPTILYWCGIITALFIKDKTN